MKLRVGHLSTFYHTAMLLMADRAMSAAIDAEIEWKLFGTGPAIVKALEQKELDLAYIGLPPVIIGVGRGAPLVCIAGGHMEGTVLCGRPGYAGYPELAGLNDILNQFRGRTLGVPGSGSIHDVILKDSLRKAGLEGSVAVRNYPWADMVMEAVVKNEVAAAFGTPALAVAVKRYAGGRILFPPDLLWPDNPSYGIVADRGFLEAHQGLCAQFLSAHEKAAELLRIGPDRAAAVIARFVGFIDEDFVLETLQVSPRYCAQLTDEYVACSMQFVAAMKNLGYIGRLMEPGELFDRTLINSIHPEKAHYKGETHV